MKLPPVPANEAERLADLRSFEILDTEAEASFDGLTKIAASILEVPIALISLIDADRQWFKSHYGLSARQTPRDVSFCGHVVGTDVPLVVADAFLDERFADNPLVTGEPRVRFYAGMPLRSSEGFVLGTLCAIAHEPKQLDARQHELLTLLAAQVVDQLEAHRKRRQLAREQESAVKTASRLNALLDAMVEGVVLQDGEGKITDANPAALRILGLSLAQMTGRTSLDPRWRSIREDGSPFPGEEHPAMLALRDNRPASAVMGVHLPSGRLSWIDVNALPLLGPAGELHGSLTTFHDISAIKAAHALAEQLGKQERLVTTGTLAAGVGHEINNPLASILMNVDYLAEEVRDIAGGSPSGRLRTLLEVLAETREGVERIRVIVRGLRALVREDTDPRPTDLTGAVEIAINMAGHDLRHKASVETSLAVTPLVMADDARLSQVLVHLLVNAAQAFSEENPGKNRVLVHSALEPDGGVSITVSDNGPGMVPEVIARIFDPFFTTKPAGQGTGLGLSLCQSIMTAIGGEIRVQSEPGVGTSFQLFLAVAEAPLPTSRPGKKPIPEGGGRVLVVDDDQGVLRSIKRALGKEHEVVVLDDPRDAVELFEQGQEFDVIFCDLMMPHLSGDLLYARVLALAPTLAERFVFISGGAVSAATQAFLAEVANERLEKPFSVQNLRGIARRYASRPATA